MQDKIIRDLGANFRKGDDEIIEDLIDDYMEIASNESNRKKEDPKLFPYIKKAVKSAYILRGTEGMSSQSEGSISESYQDIEDKLRRDVRSVRVFR